MRGKAVVKCALVAVMLCGMGSAEGFAEESEELILTVETGSGEDEFMYKYAELTYGPDDFYVGNDKILLLDTCGRRIMVFSSDGDWQTNIELTDVTGIPQSFEYVDDKIYVFDTEHDVYTYNTDGILKGIDAAGLSIWNLASDGEKLILMGEEECLYAADFSGSKMALTKMNVAEENISEPLNNIADDTMLYTDRLVTDTQTTFYTTYQVYSADEIMTEFRVNSVNDGQVVASEILEDYGSWYYYPLNFIQADEDCIYYMKGLEDSIQIVKRNFSGEIQDTSLDTRIDAAKSESVDVTEPDAQSSTYTTISKTRISVFDTATSYVGYSWTLNAINKEEIEGTTLPTYISSITSVPKAMTGVPYCWGGCVSLAEFKEQIKAGYQAGNINTTNSLSRVSNTTGVDCSGFVSKIYGIGYTTTSGFSSGGYQKTSFSKMCRADFLLKRAGTSNSYGYSGSGGNHVMIFSQRTTSTVIVIVDSSTSTGKTTVRGVNQSNLIKEGYQPYTPCITEHLYVDGWTCDATYHYHVCSNGCNNVTKEAHVWSGNKCAACGYTK